MRRYVTGMMTGALVGAVMAGVWLLRPRPPMYRRVWRQANAWAPKAVRWARRGSRWAGAVRRRMG
ncbi:MAG: hypothetical protein K6U14_03215 [Firmicutes bacterium]|nr:hypothetical protein [Alicyclobacillaceae bacterium]MCL6496628.1 hypothetical protein [Bacillota bacterium]